MKQYLLLLQKTSKGCCLLLLLLTLASCGASRKSQDRGNNVGTTEMADPVKAKVIQKAKTFVGTRYKYGGTTKRGMDCSGLIYTSYLSENISLPRTSRQMSHLGKRLNLREVNTGDLLFFETDKKKKVINHVGLVVEAAPTAILFIHSTSSRGVIISSLEEDYWKDSFVMARRIE